MPITIKYCIYMYAWAHSRKRGGRARCEIEDMTHRSAACSPVHMHTICIISRKTQLITTWNALSHVQYSELIIIMANGKNNNDEERLPAKCIEDNISLWHYKWSWLGRHMRNLCIFIYIWISMMVSKSMLYEWPMTVDVYVWR